MKKIKINFCIALVLGGTLFNFANLGRCVDETATKSIATNNTPIVEKVLSSIAVDTNFSAVKNPVNTNETVLNLLVKPEYVKPMSDLSSYMTHEHSNLVFSETLANTNYWMGTNHWSDAKSVLASFKSSIPANFTNSAWAEVDAAANFLQELNENSHLPGTTKDDGAIMSTESLDLAKMKAAKFPFSLTFDRVSTGDLLTNHYTMIRTSPNAAWQLKKAWRTDIEGKTLIEWPTK